MASRTALVDPQGELVTVPDNQVRDALRAGFKAPDEAQTKEIEQRLKYGQGLGTELRAGLEGAARGLTFGLSDVALPALGLGDKEGLRERKERNPWAAGGGELAGVGAGLVAPVGLLGAGVRTAGTLGELAGQGAVRGAEALGLGGAEGLAARALAKGGQHAVSSAVEGALYGGGQGVSEAALGDPEDAAQKLLAHATMGAILGGVLGGAGGALGGAGSAFLARASGKAAKGAESSLAADALASEGDRSAIRAWLENLAGEQALDAAGLMKRDYKKIMGKSAKPLTEAATDEELLAAEEASSRLSLFDEAKRIAYEKRLARAGDSLEDVTNRVQGVMDEAQAGAKQFIKALDEHAATTGAPTFDLNAYADDLENKLARPLIDRPEKQSELASLMDRIKGYRDLAEKRDDGMIPFSEAERLKRDFDANFASTSTTKRLAREARGLMNERIEQSAKNIAADMKPGSYEQWRAHKRVMEALIPVREAGKDRLAAQQSNRKISLTDYITGVGSGGPLAIATGHPGAALAGAGIAVAHKLVREYGNAVVADYAARAADILGGVQGARVLQLAQMERAANKVTTSIDKSVDALVAKIKEAPKAAVPTAVKAYHEIRLAPKERRKREVATRDPYDERLTELANLSQNPDLLLQRLSETTGELNGYAPRVAAEMRLSATMAVNYLYTKAPKNPDMNAVPELRRAWRPSPPELLSFERTLRAVHDPVGVIRDFQHGHVSSEAADALRTIYPHLYQRVVMRLVPKIAETEGIPLQRRLELADVLGVPLDSLTDPATGASWQQMYAEPVQKPAPPARPRVSKNIRAKQSMTPMQRLFEEEA